MLQTLQTLDRRILYVLLIILCSIGLFIPAEIPSKVDQQTADLYAMLSAVPEGKTVLIQTDWTISTRGENMAHLEGLVRLLMSRNIKFVYYTATSEAPALQVSRDVVRRVNAERKKAGQPEYKWNDDCVSLGLFPNAEGINTAMGQDLRKAWGDRKVKRYDGQEVGAFDTAALRNVQSIKDIPAMIVITASSTNDIAVERLSDKVPLGLMCTGVVGGTSLQYYPAQFHGIASGLKGGYEFEYMMKHGINHKEADGKIVVENEKVGKDIPPVLNSLTLDRASKYYLSLHIALGLMIVVVIVGNVSMLLAKRAGSNGGQA